MDHRNAYSNDCTTDKVMEPLTQLFTDLVTQLKLLVSSGQGDNPNHDGKIRHGCQTGSNNGPRQHANDHYQKRDEPHKDHHYRSHFRHNGHQWGHKDGHKGNSSKRPHARINEVESGSECTLECLAMSDIEEHLEEEVEPVPASPKN